MPEFQPSPAKSNLLNRERWQNEPDLEIAIEAVRGEMHRVYVKDHSYINTMMLPTMFVKRTKENAAPMIVVRSHSGGEETQFPYNNDGCMGAANLLEQQFQQLIELYAHDSEMPRLRKEWWNK